MANLIYFDLPVTNSKIDDHNKKRSSNNNIALLFGVLFDFEGKSIWFRFTRISNLILISVKQFKALTVVIVLEPQTTDHVMIVILIKKKTRISLLQSTKAHFFLLFN